METDQIIEEATEEVVPVDETTVVEETEEVQEPGSEEETPEKTFTQEEVDDLIGKRLARAERKRNREQPVPEPEAPQGELKQDDYTDQQEFIDAKIQQGVTSALAERDQSSVAEKFADREEDVIEQYPDYIEKVTNNQDLQITEVMADVIKASDVGPQVAYHLGDNPKEAARIAKLPSLMQAREIGLLEAQITAKPPPKQQSQAPAPIVPITPKSGGETAMGDLSDDEYRKKSLANRRQYG